MSNIKSLPAFEQPRVKFVRKGSVSLSDAELLALIICSGNKELSALELSKWLLTKYNYSLKDLARSTYPELMKVKGIGEAKALSIVAAFELGRRKTTSTDTKKVKIKSSLDAYGLVKGDMEDLKHEVFKVILMNRSNIVIKVVEISTGGVSGTVVDPKLIFKAALDHLASSIILAHNHPSGSLNPSKQDIDITKKICDAGKQLEIQVLDHVILTTIGYFSFADEGLLH